MIIDNITGPRRRRLATIVTPFVLAALNPSNGIAQTSTAPAEATQTAPATARPTMARFMKIRWPSNGSLSPDGSFYYVHNPDGIYQLYRRPAGESETVQKLTFFADGISSYSLSDDGKWIVANAGKGGNEQDDLYLIDTASGRPEPLLVYPDTVFGSVIWSRDSKAFAYRANLESKSDFHVYIYDLEARSSRRVLARKGYFFPVDFNRDHSKLMVGKYNSSTYSQLFEVDLTTGDIREISPPQEQWSFAPVGYTHDDRHFLVRTDHRGDLMRLRSIDLTTGVIEPVVPEFDVHESDGASFNQDRIVLAVLLNEDGYRSLKLRAMPRNVPIDLPPIERGIVGNVGFCGSQMLYSLNNAKTPGVMYKWTLDSPGAAPVKMTRADTQGIDTGRFTLPTLIKYESFDGLQVPAFLYTPPGYKKGLPIPFIVSYHGGPEGQYRPYFSRHFQYFLTRGFGVLAPNVRGSSGYGKKYLEMDNYKLRMDSVMDGVWAARWLVQNGYTRAGMIGAYGGSYGGFMVVATITQAPKLFGAACNVVGIVNFKTFLERTKAYRRKLREVEYGPLTDPEFLESISPIRLVDQIQTPILIAHGRNDPRVPVHEAEQLHKALQERGGQSELLIFEDEGHGFRKEDNRIEFYERLADFFEKHLNKKERS